MSKYQSLTDFLSSSGNRQLRMKFAEIEKILGFPLPASKQYPAWWSNNPSNNVMTKAWLAAGYKTEQVDVAGEKVTFVAERPREPSPGPMRAAPSLSSSGRHPAFGVWKGKVTPLPDYDYTQPADPDWGKAYED